MPSADTRTLFSLQFGHARGKTAHCAVFLHSRAASLPEKRAFRSSSGVCEPAFLVLRTAEPSSNPKPTPPKEKDTGHHTGVLYLLSRVDKKDANEKQRIARY